MFCGTLGFHGTPVEVGYTELDYIYPHTRKSILTTTNPITHLLDLHRNVFRPNNALLVAGTKLKSTYKSLELTTGTRLPTAIHHILTKFYNVI